MKEEDLIELGFNRTDVSAEESGDEAFYYYDIDFGVEKGISLISPANTEVKDGEWFVEIFEDATISFDDIDQLNTFIKIVKENTIK